MTFPLTAAVLCAIWQVLACQQAKVTKGNIIPTK